MAISIGSLLIRLGLDSGTFKSGLTVAERDFKSTVKQFERSGRRLQGLGKTLSVAITAPVLALGTAAVRGFVDQQKAVADVESALRSMGSVAGKTSAELQKTADAMELRSLFDADVILKDVTANLLTFGNISGTVFDRAQQAAIDMAERLQTGPKDAAIQLGKALQDPVRGVTALTKAGVKLDEGTKKLIKSLVQSGQIAKAQGIILSELETEFHGAAAAAADATPWRKAVVEINQAMDKIGEAILPTIKVIADTVASLARSFSQLSEPMQRAVVISLAMAAAAGPLLAIIGQMIVSTAGLAAAMKIYGAAVLQVSVASGSAVPAIVGLRAAVISLTVSMAPYLVAVGAIAAAIYFFTNNTNKAAQASAEYRDQQDKLREIQDKTESATAQLASATGEARRAALENAKALRAETREFLANARAALLAAKAKSREVAARNLADLQESSRNLRGAGGGIDPVLTQGRVNTNRKKQAAADLKAAQDAVAATEKELARLNQIINRPAPQLPGLGGSDEKKDKKASGPTAAEIEARFVDELDSYRAQLASAAAQTATNAEERAEYDLRGVELARRSAIRQIQSDDDYSKAQKERLVNLIEAIAEEERAAVAMQKLADQEQELADIAGIRFDHARELLQNDLALADTQDERRRIALEILALEQEYRRNQLEMVLASAVASDAEKRRAQAILDSLDSIEARENAAASRANETDLQRYLRDLNKTPGQINEAIDGIRMRGLDALNEGLLDAITGVKSLGAVFRDIANQIIADLLRIAIRRAIIAPLANAIFGGSSSGSSPVNLLDGTPYGGPRAGGGAVRPSEYYLVGERGPELFMPGRSGSILPNDALAGAGRNMGVSVSRIELVDTTGLFEMRVRDVSGQTAVEVVRQAAPAIISAGGEAGVARMNRINQRRLA